MVFEKETHSWPQETSQPPISWQSTPLSPPQKKVKGDIHFTGLDAQYQ